MSGAVEKWLATPVADCAECGKPVYPTDPRSADDAGIVHLGCRRASVPMILTEAEQEQARAAAQDRFDVHEGRGTRQRYGHGRRDVNEDRDSIGAEIAVARLVGHDWRHTLSPTEDRAGDVGEGVQVRQTPYSYGRLLLHPEDADDHWWFLVTGCLPEYMIVGYILGQIGKRLGAWRELQPGRPCWYVEQDDLTKPLVGGPRMSGYVPNAEPVAACELRPGDHFASLLGGAEVESVEMRPETGDTVIVHCVGGVTWNLPRNTIVTRVEHPTDPIQSTGNPATGRSDDDE